MKASDLFVRCLENEGVQYIFGVPGEENEDLLFSLENSSIRFIPTRHEQGAAFMANVWGRLTGKAGVCLSTLGPGATNLVTGVADANLDRSPLVAITGQASLARTHKESHQYLNVINIFRPITKWNSSVKIPDSIPEIIRKAFKVAEEEKPGATQIELPEDVAKLETQANPIPVVRVRRPDPDQHAIREAVSLLVRAAKPLILAGNGSIRKGASEPLRKLCLTYHIPVVHTFMAQGAISDESPESLLTIGLGFRDFVMDAVDQADLVLTVGVDSAEFLPKTWNPNMNKKIIHIDFRPAEVDSYYQPSVEIVADIAVTLRQIKERLDVNSPQFNPSWYQPVRQRIIQDIHSYTLNEHAPFTIPGVLNVLRLLLHEEDLLISDVGAHKIWIARNYQSRCPNGCIISNGLASMGIALPGAVAAALHSPHRRIVAAMGDGGFLMNSQEIETAKRLGVAFVILIFNDNDYGLISWKQRKDRGHSTGTQLTNPNFVTYAESFGIKGYRPETFKELREQLKVALERHELSIIDIPVDQSPLDKLFQTLGLETAKEESVHYESHH